MKKTIILGGFLGSGKTTALLQFAHYLAGENPQENKVMIIENEIGEVSIDDKMIQSEGYSVKTMFSGCACCTIKGQVEIHVRDLIKNYDPEYIIFEASGVAFPDIIRRNLIEALDIDCTVCCIVDAKRWLRLAAAMETMIRDQINGADTILINKTDLIDEITHINVQNSLKRFNDTAEVISISAAKTIHHSVWEKVVGNVNCLAR
ncbi:MAG: GTP-binding protein [Eubacteriaceae bacterium]|nr:GTP-binding protein [Eubacteriaceae bacterium]